MFTSVIMSIVVVVALGILGSLRPPWTIQPATVRTVRGTAPQRARVDLWLATALDDEDDTSIVMDSLRAIGVVRRRVDRPVLGRKAYVRIWERLRALVVLAAIIVSLGALLAGTIGIIVLAAGFLLEQAIS